MLRFLLRISVLDQFCLAKLKLRQDIPSEHRDGDLDDVLVRVDFLHPADKAFERALDDLYAVPRLVIELDGSQHYLGDGPAEDEARSDYLKRFDITVIRIPNNMIRTNFSGVCTYIDHAVRELRRQRGI